MGLVDNVKCEQPLDEDWHNTLTFQSKDLDPANKDIMITKEGRLIWHKYYHETVPEEERPYYEAKWKNPKEWLKALKMIGSVRIVHEADIDLQFHGTMKFYALCHYGETQEKFEEPQWIDYDATFEKGQLVEIKRVIGRYDHLKNDK
jgi:hypothetical protein